MNVWTNSSGPMWLTRSYSMRSCDGHVTASDKLHTADAGVCAPVQCAAVAELRQQARCRET